MVQRKEGLLRYGNLPLSDGGVADNPTAFILVENCGARFTDYRGPRPIELDHRAAVAR